MYSPHQAYYQAESSYQEHKVLSASPIELVCLLYEGAIDGINDARRHLESGDILARGRSVARVQAIVAELVNSLNGEADRELAKRLTLLYDYVLQKLEDAHREQQSSPLAEAEQILRNLQEGWQQIAGVSAQGVVGQGERRS